MQVVMGAGSSGILLHEAIGHGMEADFNRKGISIYADRIGKPVAEKFVNIVDEGTMAHARGALNVDDEGNAVGTTRLVENGILATYLHDTISAKHYKVAPTGNGRRESYAHVPMPRMRATYMLPGPHKKDEIVASVKKGVFCESFSNGQVRIGAGDFTFFVKNGWLIEDGKLTRPIKDVNIIGNGPKVLEKIDMVADDLEIDEGGWTCGKDGQSVPVSQGLPTVRVSSITVGGTGKGAEEGAMAKELFDIADEALRIAKKGGAREAAARVDRSRNVELSWRDGKVETIKEATTRQLQIQLYVDGRYGDVSTSDLRPEALEAFIKDSIVLTRSLAKDPFRTLPDPKLYQGQAKVDLLLEDPKHGGVTPERRKGIAKALEEAARGVKGSDRIVSVSSSFDDVRSESVMATSNGFRGSVLETYFGGGAFVSVADPDGRKPEDGHYAGSRFVGELPDPAEVGRRAGERAVSRIGAKKPASAILTMVVENRAARRLVGPLLGPMSASSIQQKRSFLEGKLGQAIGSPVLGLTDDPLVPKGFGSRLFDGEGIAARPLPLFEGGVLKSFYVDTYYGKKLGMEPTTGGMSNLAWKLGDRGPGELVASIETGVLVDSFLGGNSNSTTGDFSFGVAGFMIRGGKIAEPVSELNVAGNHLALWKQLVAVGNDPYPYSASRTPTLVFEGVSFAGV
jgi:PmbA protein